MFMVKEGDAELSKFPTLSTTAWFIVEGTMLAASAFSTLVVSPDSIANNRFG